MESHQISLLHSKLITPVVTTMEETTEVTTVEETTGVTTMEVTTEETTGVTTVEEITEVTMVEDMLEVTTVEDMAGGMLVVVNQIHPIAVMKMITVLTIHTMTALVSTFEMLKLTFFVSQMTVQMCAVGLQNTYPVSKSLFCWSVKTCHLHPIPTRGV